MTGDFVFGFVVGGVVCSAITVIAMCCCRLAKRADEDSGIDPYEEEYRDA
jgi:hypothetical protein